jgi:hypothetical protein
MPDPAANLSFVPWVREGAAAAIPAVDSLLPQPGVADLSASLSINNAPGASISIRLRGPADVTGIDARQIVRMEPLPDAQDFEPNFLACIEFDRPDFPWLFTPARANATGQLRPWLCLIVVPEQPGVTIVPASATSLPVLHIASPAKPVDELPDLAECWAWAHSQVAAPDSNATSVNAALRGATELSLSRLICPRRLEPDTAYIACVVPTFELGRKAGLGAAISDNEVTAANALAPAWTITRAPPAPPAGPAEVDLPIYHLRRFRTGSIGDFESLARALHPKAAPDGLGLRKIDISHPGFALSSAIADNAAIDLEGALKPMNAPNALPAWPAGMESPFKAALAPVVNAPGLAAIADPHADPLLAPTLYGRWYAAKPTVALGATSWLDELNLEPRYRAIAAFGTQVVQQQQEALMASAWEQAAELREANQRLRRLQLSLVVGKAIYARHLSALAPEAMMRVAAPAFGRLRTTLPSDPIAKTVVARIAPTALPVHATSSAMSRIGRVRGPLTRRLGMQGVARSTTSTWIGKMAGGSVATFVTLPTVTLATISAVRQRLPANVNISGFGAVTQETVVNMRGRPLFSVAAEGQSVTTPPLQALPPSADSAAARDFRIAASEHLKRVNPGRTTILTFPVPLHIDELRVAMVNSLEPRINFKALTRAVIATGPNATLPVDTPSSAPVGIDTIAAAPRFPQPMYEALRDLSQDLLLPGLSSIDPDTVIGLKTNRRFIEAYMLGLNVEMGGELLWRGFPTDQRSTYFDQFWDVTAAKEPRPDIDAISGWGERKLGDAAGAPAREQFVMLMRSALLRRYPNAIIYAAPAIASGATRTPDLDPAHEVFPSFRGEMKPDVSFFGFDITPAAAQGSDGAAGYYIVIQEHPTEPRFGVDVGTPAGSERHIRVADGSPAGLPSNNLTWGRNAAHVAGILRRRPFRVAIHASMLVHRP